MPKAAEPGGAAGTGWVAPTAGGSASAGPQRRPRDATAVTEMLRDRPTWEGDARDPGEERTTRLP